MASDQEECHEMETLLNGQNDATGLETRNQRQPQEADNDQERPGTSSSQNDATGLETGNQRQPQEADIDQERHGTSSSQNDATGLETRNQRQPQEADIDQERPGTSSSQTDATGLETRNQRQQQEAYIDQERPGTSSSGAEVVQEPWFKKKICVHFLPSGKCLLEFRDIYRENIRCECGLPYKEHDRAAMTKDDGLRDIVKDLIDSVISIGDYKYKIEELTGKHIKPKPNSKWNLADDPAIKEVDGAEMGDIKFCLRDSDGDITRSFTRLSDGTDMSYLKEFLNDQWNLFEPYPELVISIIGTTDNKNLIDKLVNNIMAISRRVSLIIFTSGLESDNVAKRIGDAVMKAQRWTTERDTEKSKAKIKCVGITTWAPVKDVLEQVPGRNTYQIKANKVSPGYSYFLNPGHSHFLLVDNGMTDNFSKDTNEFWVKLQKALKAKGLNVLNLILGKDEEEGKYLKMIEQLLSNDLPVSFLQHARKYIDTLTGGLLRLRDGESWNFESFLAKPSADEIRLFLDKYVLEDNYKQNKNVMTICDLLCEESQNPEVENSLEASCLRTLTLSLFIKARMNNGNHAIEQEVLEIVKLASLLGYWGASMENLLARAYDWNDEEKNDLKETFKNCLLQDQSEACTVFARVGCCDIQQFLSVNMLARLYSDDKYLVKDPLQAVFKRRRLSDTFVLEQPAQKIEQIELLKEIVHNLLLPECYIPEFGQEEKLTYPFKELMIWAVLSKKWTLVDYIISIQKDDILVWFLATAYLCKALALSQRDPEIKTVYKGKQHTYEDGGKRLLEILTVQRGNPAVGGQRSMSIQNLCLERKSELWGGLCPADLALLGNFKTFVKSETFHNYIDMRWKRKQKVSYLLMVLAFCSSVVSKVHYFHQIWLILWIICYGIGELTARYQQQRHVRFHLKKKKDLSFARNYLYLRVLPFVRNYLYLLLLFLLLLSGFVYNRLRFGPWGELSYGLACVILIAFICVHFMSTYRLFALQISILQRAIRDILSCWILIILLLWSGSMVFHAALCLEEKVDSIKDASGSQTTVVERTAGGWANTLQAAWLLYLSLYGEYSFELTDTDHLACIKDSRALMWVSYVLIGFHILIGNVLLMNLLISVISTKTGDLKSDLVYVWKSNWYRLTLHYEKQTISPPPFNIVELYVRLVRHAWRKGNQADERNRARDQPDAYNLQLYQQEALDSLRLEQTGRTD